MNPRLRLRCFAIAAASVAWLGAPALRAEDPPDRAAQVVAELAEAQDDAAARALVAEIVGLGDVVRPHIAKAIEEEHERRLKFEPALDALDAAARLRAEAVDTGSVAFWVAIDEARTRTVAFDAVLRAAVPDAPARKGVEDALRRGDEAVDVYVADAPAPSDADLAAVVVNLRAAGPAAVVRLLGFAAANNRQGRASAIRALSALQAKEVVPALVFYVLGPDESTQPMAVAALASLAGYEPIASRELRGHDLTEKEALVPWWDPRTPRDRVAERHLAHRVLLDLALPGVRPDVADERIARLNRVLGRGRDVIDVPHAESGDAKRSLDDATLKALRDAWRRQLPPATWRAAVAVLRVADSYDGDAVGEGGERSSTRRAYDELEQDAPADAVVALLGAKEPILRLYAFRALLAHEGLTPRVLAAFEQIARSDGEVESQFGCMVGPRRPGDVALEDLPWDRKDVKRALLEVLIDRGIRLESMEALLWNVPVGTSRRPQLRKMADEEVEGALMAIAHWHDPEDAAWFASKLDAAGEEALDDSELLNAIKEHGATGTLSRLLQLAPAFRKECAAKNDWYLNQYVGAIAASRDSKAEAALWSLLGDEPAKAPPRLLQAVGAEVGAAPESAFTDLRWKLWEIAPWTRAAAVGAMAKADAARATRLALRDLGTPRPEYDAGAKSGELFLGRLSLVYASDPAAAVAALATQLSTVDYFIAAAIGPTIASWRDDRLVEPLFGALTTSTSPHAFLLCARVLLAYDRPEIDARLRKAVAETKHLREDWGGKELAKLLADR